MNKKSILLLARAREKMKELSKHPVLSKYWHKISLVLKGSVSRGNADRYSDIDLVVYSSQKVKKSMISGYRAQGLTERTDGVFIHFNNGHYNLESYESLGACFSKKDFARCWDIEHSILLTDAGGRFARIVKEGRRKLFQNKTEIVKRAYLDIQLDLDWMRMPVARADRVAVFLHAAKIVQGLSRIAYLLDGRSYPPDKWVAKYIPSTSWGRANAGLLKKYIENCDNLNALAANKPFAENPIYKDAGFLVSKVSGFIRRTHGKLPWIDKWYNYV